MSKSTDRRIDRRHRASVPGFADEPDPGRYERFLDRLGALIDAHVDGCWVWKGRTDDAGYGVAPDGKVVHRVVYEVLAGPIPAGMVLHHECEVRQCCNPAHLVPMTNGDHVVHHAALRRKAS